MRPYRRRSLSFAATLATLFLVVASGPLGPTAGASHVAIPSGRTAHRVLADYENEMAALATAHPNLVRRITLPLPSVQGRTIHGIEITHNVRAGGPNGKPVYAIVGVHHGNEPASGDLPMEYALWLVQQNGTNAEVTALLDQVRVVIVPVVNVDGHAANTRQNANRVDMNRNYGLGWRPDSMGGTAPFSEPETRNMEWLISHYQATTAVTMHTCINIVLYPPLQQVAGLTEDHDRFVALASEMAADMGSTHSTSADDAETTGEMIDWSYYATRGLNLTIETCTESGESRNFETMVVDEWLGVRDALTEGLRHAADPDEHATIRGKAPGRAVLTLSKEFDLWTSPLLPVGSVGVQRVPTALETTLVMPKRAGAFTWAVNPSRRPVPAYRQDGIHTGPSGFYDESWTLTCARPNGDVLQELDVFVDLGDVANVDLTRCKRLFTGAA